MTQRLSNISGLMLVTTVLMIGAVSTSLAGSVRTIKSEHYELHTDLDEALATDISDRLEAIHAEYSRRLSIFRADDAAKLYQVVVTARRADAERLTGLPPGAAGVFIRKINTLAATMEGYRRESLRLLLQHEAFHQFAHHAISQDLPQWLNEGLAEYFGEGVWTGAGFLLGQVPPRRIHALRADAEARRLIPFSELMSLTNAQWNSSLKTVGNERASTQYNQSWAMVHFLIHGSNGSDAFRPRFIRYLQLIHEGTPADDAFTQAFSANIAGFQKRFNEYLNGLNPTPEAMMMDRSTTLAEFLILLNQNDVPVTNIDDFRENVISRGVRMQFEQGEVKWGSESGDWYFRDRTGRFFGDRFLYLDPRPAAPLPDIVCRSGSLQFRTRFHRRANDIDYDVVIEDR